MTKPPSLGERACKALNHFFWRTLCLCPDGEPQWFIWRWNTFTGRIAAFFHRQYCQQCNDERAAQRDAHKRNRKGRE